MIKEILETIKVKIEKDSSLIEKINSGIEFEDLVFNLFQSYKGVTVKHNGIHSFPDLDINYGGKVFGIEIKFSGSGNWRSKGNSVFESLSSNEEYKEIYIFYGRKPKRNEKINHIDIKFAPYGDSIERIEVTHSPRFAINMNNEDSGISKLFDEYENYANFRVLDNKNKNEFLRKYFELSKDNLGDKWYINDYSKLVSDEIPTMEAIPFKSLNTQTKKQTIAEAFILFPKYLFEENTDYSPFALYLVTKYFVYASSLRDSFTSGGKTTINQGKKEFPRMLYVFYSNRTLIKKLLENPKHDDFDYLCFKNWRDQFPEINFVEEDSLSENYLKILTRYKPLMEVRVEGNLLKENINLINFY